MITQARIAGAVVTLSASPSPTGEVSIGIGHVTSDGRLMQNQSFHVPADTAEEWALGVLEAVEAARAAVRAGQA